MNRTSLPKIRPGVVAALALAFAGTLAFGLLTPTKATAQAPGTGTTPTCQERCRLHAQEVLKKCQDSNGENCEARAKEAYNTCVTRCGKPVEPPACDVRCRQHARELLAKCEANGGENCAARALKAFEECVLRCKRQQPPACEARCQQMAQDMIRKCEAHGGQNCAQRAREAYRNCMAKCPTVSPRP